MASLSHRDQEKRIVSVHEAFLFERLQLEQKIGAAAERIAKAKTDEERSIALLKYEMLREERNWI